MRTSLTDHSLAFDYVVDAQELALNFAADGYVSIHFLPGSGTVIRAHVTAGSTRPERIPDNATEAAIVFTALPETTSGGVSLTRESKTGTVEDSGRSRIALLVRF